MNLFFKTLLLFFAFHITLLQGSVIAPFGKVHVRLTNTLGPGSSLTIQSKSKQEKYLCHEFYNVEKKYGIYYNVIWQKIIENI